MELWDEITVRKTSRGITLALSLSQSRKEIALRVARDELKSKNGLKAVLDQLQEVFATEKHDLTFEEYDKFESLRREKGQSMNDYIIRVRKCLCWNKKARNDCSRFCISGKSAEICGS